MKLRAYGGVKWTFNVSLAVVAIVTGMYVNAAFAAPGTPGVPQAPAVLYEENFENNMSTTPVLLTGYTGAAPQNMTYTAASAWVNGANCNGIILSFNTPDALGCGFAGQVRAQAQAMGIFNNQAAPDDNHALTAYTAGAAPGADAVQFETQQPISLSSSQRFLTLSVDAAAQNCTVSAPLFKMYLLDGATETPTFSTPINPCTSTGDPSKPPQTIGNSRVGRYPSNEPILFSGNSLGIRMRNGNGGTFGNDGSIDNVRLLDVTPQLDKAFSPKVVAPGQAAVLSFTITNTSELLQKEGWSFTDTLPAGVTVATPASINTTCSNGVVTTVSGSDTITVSGDLMSGQSSCQVTVEVVSSIPGEYENCSGNLSDVVGLDMPNCSTVGVAPAFSCSADGYLFQVPGQAQATSVRRVDMVTGSSQLDIAIPNARINATGYNVLDDYIYGWDLTSHEIVRVGSDGTLHYLGTPAGFTGSTGQTYNIGDIDENGHYWMATSGSADTWHQIDLNPASPTYMQQLSGGSFAVPGFTEPGSDWSFVPGTNGLYSVGRNGVGQPFLVRFDRTSKVFSNLGPVAVGGSGSLLGALYADSNGFLYGSNNTTGAIFRIDVNAVSSTFFAAGPASSGNDGARCVDAPIPIDFGDAPDTYGTVLGSGGPRHSVPDYDEATHSAPLMIGAQIDIENDGSETSDANGDDTDAISDEDGVTSPIYYYDGVATDVDIEVTNNSTEPATLAGWIDLNSDGQFTNDERATTIVGPSTGLTIQSLTFPSGTPTGDTFARFRLYSGIVADPQPTGSADGGEVEDYVVRAGMYEIEKQASPERRMLPGETVTYTVTVSSTGGAPVPSATFSDSLGEVLDDAVYNNDAVASVGSVSYAQPTLLWEGALAAGQVATITYSVTVQEGGDRQVMNAVVGGQCPDPAITDPAHPQYLPECSTLTLVQDPQADLTIAKSHSGSPVAGSTMEYRLDVKNNGPYDTPSFVVTDHLDDHLTFVGGAGCSAEGQDVTCVGGALVSGATATLTITVMVAPIHDGSAIENTVTVSGPLPDPQLGNNTSVDAFDPSAEADVLINKTIDGTMVAGSEVSYTLAVTNNGPSAASGVTVTDQLPSPMTPFSVAAPNGWNCVFVANGVSCLNESAMEPGVTDTLHVTGLLPSDATGSIENVATVTATTFDPNTDNNRSAAASLIAQQADIALQKTLVGDLIAGSQATYQLHITNNGPSDAVDPVVTDELPQALRYVRADSDDWSCDAHSQTITCTTNGIPNGDRQTVDVIVEVDRAASGEVINGATVSATTPDPQPNNNSSTHSGHVHTSDGLARTGVYLWIWYGTAIVPLVLAVGARQVYVSRVKY